MKVAIVGCGFVADYYLQTLRAYPELEVLGLYDRAPERAELLSRAYQLPQYNSLDALLSSDAEMVINLTNPREHHPISLTALEHGKHVYSEKPLAMDMADARELVAAAADRGLVLSSAPCSLLGETAQTLWAALRRSVVGQVRLVYAELDDGMVHTMAYRKWLSRSGLPWPYKDEFEVGCTIEHAGYYLTWLAAFFGPAASVTTFASEQVPDKLPRERLDWRAPDFSVACIQFHSGVVARVTCSIVAPHDHSLRIIGDRGILRTDDCWDYRSGVSSRRQLRIRRRSFWSPVKRRHKLPAPPVKQVETQGSQSMDFARGPAEVARAVREGRPCRLSPEFSLHVNELTLAINHSGEGGPARHELTTTFAPIAPMEWAP